MSPPRTVLAAHLVWGSHRAGDRRLLAPDEDEFTLGVAAAEGVIGERSPSVNSVHLIGDLPKVADWGIGAALGRGDAVVVRSGMTDGSVVEAIRSAATASASESALVIGVGREGSDSQTGREWSAAALALLVGEAEGGPGLGSIAASSVVPPDDAAAPDPGGRASIGPTYSLPRPPPPIGTALQSIASVKPGPEVLESRSSLHGRLTIEDPSGDVGRPGGSGADERGGSPADLSSVSQGAYVPYPRYRENIGSRWNFEADRCTNCGRLNFPIHGSCLGCGSADTLHRERLPKNELVVESATVVASGAQPTEFDDQVERSGPYGVVLVRLAPGVRATLQLVRGSSNPVRIGSRVSTRLRRLYAMEGEWRYGRKAVPSGTGS